MIKRAIKSAKLVWFEDLGYGYVDPTLERIDYGKAYFENYVALESSDINDGLMEARCAMVDRHLGDEPCHTVVDIGCGSGAFITHRTATRNLPTYGYDVNPHSVHWLMKREDFHDPFVWGAPHASFWDSLEHFDDPLSILDKVAVFAFISIPIFRDAQHALASKHYKPGEHIWMFTEPGLVGFMAANGFTCVEHGRMEEDFGREDIGSFVFRRTDRSRWSRI